jgi:hydrogenase nickel incorporation protein HypB
MCTTCGCGQGREATVTKLDTGVVAAARDRVPAHDSHRHDHSHPRAHSHDPVPARADHDPAHPHAHGHEPESPGDQGRPPSHSHGPSLIELEARVLAKNDALAAKNRAWFAGRRILALNLVSSPGAGKTSLLERTIRENKDELGLYVIEGDQATSNDSHRIDAAGAPVVQLNTGTGCHLDADMVAHAAGELRPAVGSIVFIENVGNLVCPALFDLGERAKVAILSVPEGDDKPLKYPHMFRASSLMLISKLDLLPHVDFDVAKATAHARSVNPKIDVLTISCRTGEGVADWYDWLRRAASTERGG